MNTPQLENGYIRIANEIVKKFKSYRISGDEWLILWTILSKTYGFNKKDDHISITQFENDTGLKRANVYRAMKKLLSKKIIVVIKKDNSQINLYRFNKLINEWKGIIKKDTTIINKDNTLLSKKITKVLSKKIPTKDIYKDTNIKDISISSDEDSKNNINFLIGLFKVINPSVDRLFGRKAERDAMERLVGKYGNQKIENMIRALPGIVSRKYAPQITTPYQLEAKLGDLLMFLRKEQHGNSNISFEQ